MADLSKLSIEIVNDYIHRIEYAETQILAIYSGPYKNYVNATKLCKEDGKEFKHWHENKRSRNLLKCLAQAISEDPITMILNIHNDLKGSYVHPLLLSNIITMMSPMYQLLMQPLVASILATYYNYNPRLSFNEIQPQSISYRIYSEAEWRLQLERNFLCTFQYELDRYKLDAVIEEPNYTYVLEFDEKDHSGYCPFAEVSRYRMILKILGYLQKKLLIIRFSDSYTYTDKKLRKILRVASRVDTKHNIIYVCYRKHRMIRVDLHLAAYSLYSLNSDMVITTLS